MNAALPILGLALLWRGGLYPWQWMLAGCAAAALAWRARRQTGASWGLEERLLLALALWAVAGLPWSLRPQAGLSQAAALICLAGLLAWLRRSDGGLAAWVWPWLALGSLAAAAFLAAGWWLGIAQEAAGLETVAGFALPHQAARLIFPNQNLLAGGLLVPALLFCLDAAVRAKGTWRWLPLAALLSAALAYAGSRGAYVALGAGICVLGLRVSRSATGRPVARPLAILACATALAAAAALFLPLSRLVQRQQWQAKAGTADPNYFRRADFWKGSMRLALEKPLRGHGLAGFEAAALRLDLPTTLTPRNPVARYRLRLEHAHNEYLEAWVELGAIGLACLAALVGLLAWRRWQVPSPSLGAWEAGAEAALAAWAALALTDLNGHVPGLLFWGVAWAGILLRTAKARDSLRPDPGWHAVLGAGLMLALFSAGYALRARPSEGRPGPRALLAGALLPLDSVEAVGRASWLLGSGPGGMPDCASALIALGPPPERPRDAHWEWTAATALYLDAIHQGLGARESAAWRSRLPDCAGNSPLACRSAELSLAAAMTQRALSLSPYRAQLHLFRAQILRDLGDRAGSEAAMTRALELEPNLARAWELRARWALEEGHRGRGKAAFLELARIRALTFRDEEPDPYSLGLLEADWAWIELRAGRLGVRWPRRAG